MTTNETWEQRYERQTTAPSPVPLSGRYDEATTCDVCGADMCAPDWLGTTPRRPAAVGRSFDDTEDVKVCGFCTRSRGASQFIAGDVMPREIGDMMTGFNILRAEIRALRPAEPAPTPPAVLEAATRLARDLDGTYVPLGEYCAHLRASRVRLVDGALLADLIEAVVATGAEGWWTR